MSIVTLTELKAQLNITTDSDDVLLTQKIEAAQDTVERKLGYSIAEAYPESIPLSLKEAILQLAAWWYEQRETAVVGMTANHVPFGVNSIIEDYRYWSFGTNE